MKVYLLRHGETSWNAMGKLQGHNDIPLNNKGIEQAKIVGESLKNLNINKIYSSPLVRASETANIIGSIINKEIFVLEELKEIPIENCEKHKGIKNNQDCADYESDYWKVNQEEFLKFQERAYNIFKKLTSQGVDILIVGHGTWIKAILCKEKDYGFFCDDFVIENCELICLDLE